MTLELVAEESFDGTITSGGSEQLEVDTTRADYVQVMLDDGTTGNKPPQFNFSQHYYQPSISDYMLYSNQDEQKFRAIRTCARGAKTRFTFVNTSGADATYRIVVQSFKELT